MHYTHSKLPVICICLLLFSGIGFSLPGRAGAQEKRYVTADELAALMKKVEQLTRDNKDLKDRIKVLEADKQEAQAKPAPSQDVQAVAKDVATLKEDVKEITETVESVERNAMVDRVKIGAELRTRVDWFTFHDTETNRHENVNALASNRFRLNLEASVLDNLEFHGKLLMYKYWNDDKATTYPGRSWMNESRVPSDLNLKVERAYVDYYFKLAENLPMAFTFGRLPTTEGPPTDLRENAPRKSTFPALHWELETDGAGLALGLSNLTGLPESALRFVYQRKAEDNDEDVTLEGDVGWGSFDAYTLQFETGFNGALRDSLFVLSGTYIPHVSPFLDLSSKGLAPLEVPKSLGNLWKFTALYEAHRFLETRFDWFVGASYMRTNSNGDTAEWGIWKIPLYRFALSSKNDRENRNAWALQAGFRYNLPFEKLLEPKFGIEYNRGSRYWCGFSNAGEDPLHKLDVRGYAWDFYYLQPINKYFFARIGYTWVRKDYTVAGYMLGEGDDVTRDRTDFYFLLDAKF